MHFFFYLFSFLVVISALAAVLSNNPVHSVLHLILSFLSAGGLFIAAHAEFIAMVLIVVYVGAIAVLFLFIVMMLPVQEVKSAKFLKNYLFIFSICGFLTFLLINSWEVMPRSLVFRPPIDINHLGSVLYTDYIYVFQLAGVILLLAMVASISLALHKTKKTKKQNKKKQISRSSEVMLIDAKSGKGVDLK